MFTDFTTLAKCYITVFSKKWFRFLRILWHTIFVTGVGIVQAINFVFRIIDNLIFFVFHAVKIKPPLIIVANPRSGTTLLHRLIYEDKKRFTSFKLYHTLLPSCSLYFLIGFFALLDKLIGSPGEKFINWFNSKAFGGWDGIHSAGLNQPEEDEGPFLFNFASSSMYMIFPYFNEVPELRYADDLPEWKRKLIIHSYKTTVKRFLLATGWNKTYLMKSVFYPCRMKIMNRIFPDANVVYLVRHPYQVLPSVISMFTAFWNSHSQDIPENSEHYREWAKLAVDYYHYFHNNIDLFDKDKLMIIKYDDLIADPKAMVEKIYKNYGYDISPEFDEKLTELTERHKKFKSVHDYSLDKYRLTKEWIYENLKDIFEKYGFEK